MVNPALIFQLKNDWDKFVKEHPKFPKFIQAAASNGLDEGSVIEINITTSDGKNIGSNIKLTQSDIETFLKLKDMFEKNK